MLISGLLKLSLLDYPEHLACTIFTPGCNFRCPFCHNASLVLSPNEAENISEEDLLSFLKKRVGRLEGVCITGGEPTLQSDLPRFLDKIKTLGYQIKLDTNGSNKNLLQQLVANQLIDYIAMDIKNSKEHYTETIGLPSYKLAQVEQSVELLRNGNLPYEFRTTVVRELHTEEDIMSIGKWLNGPSPYFLQGFLNSGNLIGSGLTAYTKDEMDHFVQRLKRTMPNVSLRGMV